MCALEGEGTRWGSQGGGHSWEGAGSPRGGGNRDQSWLWRLAGSVGTHRGITRLPEQLEDRWRRGRTRESPGWGIYLQTQGNSVFSCHWLWALCPSLQAFVPDSTRTETACLRGHTQVSGPQWEWAGQLARHSPTAVYSGGRGVHPQSKLGACSNLL